LKESKLRNEEWRPPTGSFIRAVICLTYSFSGRKPIPTRHVLEAVLWILNTGAPWHMLPQSYSNYNASTLSNLVLPRDFASGFDGRCQRAS
jgi:hypothetical protein